MFWRLGPNAEDVVCPDLGNGLAEERSQVDAYR